jgi:hypothetical protein
VTDHEHLLNFIKETVMTKKHPKIEAVTLLINNGGLWGGFSAAVTSCDDRARRRSRSNGCGAQRTAAVQRSTRAQRTASLTLLNDIYYSHWHTTQEREERERERE